MHVQRFHLILLTTLCFVNKTIPVSFNSVRSFFGGTPYQEIIEKDYTMQSSGHITIKSLHGPISVKAGLDKKSVALRATKKASAKEHLDHIHVIEEEISPTRLTFRTAYDYEKVKGGVEYELTIPENAQLHLATEVGDVKIKQVHGTINVTVGHGDITVVQPQGSVQASVTQQGNVVIIQPHKPVQAASNKGTIYVKESMHNVIGKCQQGKIEVKAKAVPAKTTINLAIGHGAIKLHLPKTTNCSLIADADSGTISSQQAVTLKPERTQLNNAYWQHVKHHVRAHIGKEEANIQLYAKQGNIQLFEY